MCHDITVPGDMMVEDNETFTISVEISNPNDVIMGPSTATVNILDNDGTYMEHGVRFKCVLEFIVALCIGSYIVSAVMVFF